MFLLLCAGARASKIEKGFEALNLRDYFKAKKIFTDINNSQPDAYASYGLATIFSRADNPFFNADSAGKYICLGYNLFAAAPKTLKIANVLIDAPAIQRLADTIASHELQRVKKDNTVAAYNHFLLRHYVANEKLKREATALRDELEFDQVLAYNHSDSTRQFIITHPQSEALIEALMLRDRQLFDEQTLANTVESYNSFLQKYPGNAMAGQAYEKLFQLYRQQASVAGLKHFVSAYPQAPQNTEAWKLLFSLSVKSFSDAELTRFLEEYPGFPLKNTILKELELNKLVLFPYQKDDLSGFINAEGKFVVLPQYDAVTDFYEGLSMVSKNDSVFFINKENANAFHKYYADASVFKNGIAPVKQGSKWFFINRLGQTISKQYDEINELSDAVYVVKLDNKYGALDQYGQPLIEPRFTKLGDFKNGFAYFVEDSSYGFVSALGLLHKAEFEWISDFDSHQIAIIKQSGRYGLINASGKKILEPGYDVILKTNGPVFILVQGDAYGFYSAAGCFLSPVSYEFAKEKPAEYYTDGRLFKLIKKGEQAIMDANGRNLLPFGAYEELNFFSEGLMRVKKELKRESKYGYIDMGLNTAIAFKYQQAGNFADSLALVEQKGKYSLIDHAGTELFSAEEVIEKLSAHYYQINDLVRQIIDQHGKMVLMNVNNIQKLKPGLLIVTLNDGEIKLLYD